MARNRQINVAPRLLLSEKMQRCRLHTCKGACCLYGVWLDELEAHDLQQHADLIAPFMTNGYTDPQDWFDGRTDYDPNSHTGKVVHSLVIDEKRHYGDLACVFWRDDAKCALQTAAVENGFHPWRFKPFYCILHPLVMDDEGRITLDETPALLEEPGSCLIPAERPIPLVETFEEELRYFLGNRRYEELLRQAREDQP